MIKKLSSLLAGVALAVVAPTAAHAATPVDGSQATTNPAYTARVVSGHDAAVSMTRAAFTQGAKAAGVTLTSADKEILSLRATSCWSWDAWKKGTNVFGSTLWKSHHVVHWCGDGSWIRTQAYTSRYGETSWPGWNYKGIEQQGQRYGVNWNQYNSWSQFKFCYIEYFSCVQEQHPYHNTTVFPNGAGRWN